MTPNELNLCIVEFEQKQKLDMEERITLAYLGAYWQRVVPKHFPKLKDLIAEKPEPKKKEQSPEQMLEEIKKLNAKMGGTTF